ncbi:hypothetical protein AB0L59_40605 [Streptomyces sp. NPDC052109]|uniref:beta-xylosidase family glycoside hydrolase n=1 Tax=Streptomyces sp. NPDC052109 TaxID=3155527 RepID=UPI0034375A4E
MEWADGWPRVGPVRERHPAPAARAPVGQPPLRDDFTAPVLAPYWISPRRRLEGCWSLTERPGRLTLTATGDSLDRPGHTFVGRRQQHHGCRVAARLEAGAGRAGLSVRIDEDHHYDLEVAAGTAAVIARIGPLRRRVTELPLPVGPVAPAVDNRATRNPGPGTARTASPSGSKRPTDVSDWPNWTAAICPPKWPRESPGGSSACTSPSAAPPSTGSPTRPRPPARHLDAPHAPS